MEVLSLSHNKLARIEGLDSLTKLKKLDLTYNQITKLEGVENLTALEVCIGESVGVESGTVGPH